ncbi:MAG: hypothetical protein ACE5L7_12430 [Candidatus Aminicenantales bacterium]
MHKSKKPFVQISCSLFSRYAEKINELTQSIYSSKSVSEKLQSAQEMLKIVRILSRCPKYDGKEEDCYVCNFSLNLRREMAKLIVEAAQASS